MLSFDEVRQALRALTRSPASTLLTILLAASGSAGVVASTWVGRHLLAPPMPYTAPEQLASIDVSSPSANTLRGVVPMHAVAAWRALPQFQSITAFTMREARAQLSSGAAFDISAASVTCELLDTLGAAGPRQGRFFAASDCRANAAPVAVLTQRGFQMLAGGDHAILGQDIRVGVVPYTVVGVLPPDFRFPAPAQPDILLPLALVEASTPLAFVDTVARLRDASSARDIERQVMAFVEATPAWTDLLGDDVRVRLRPMNDMLAAEVTTSARTVMWLAFLLYALTGISLTGLLLCELAADRRAMQTRTACGATPARLFQSLAVQRAALAVVSAGAAVALLAWWMQALAAVLSDVAAYAPPLHVGLGIAGIAATVAACLTLLPLVPSALVLARMRQERVSGAFEVRLRLVTLTLQVACAVALTSVAAALVGALWTMTGTGLGFDYRAASSARLRLLDANCTARSRRILPPC